MSNEHNHTHTPGPWTFQREKDADMRRNYGGEYTVWAEDKDASPVCGAHCQANASLIAAAPDMLEALNRILSVLNVKEVPDGIFAHVNAIARAAIAAATGQA